MKHRASFTLVTLLLVLIISGCMKGESAESSASADGGMLVGAWRSKIVFKSGPLAQAKDLEFLSVYNSGGTMTESSNYDEAANSSPPAYGLWKQVGPNRFQTKYMFYTTKEPGPGDGASKGDWWPAGHGVLTENITLSSDGQAYTSTIKLDTYDRGDRLMAGSGEGTGAGTRIVF